MTVISGMKFGQSEGAIVADEQSSDGFRKYDMAAKLSIIESPDKTVRAVLGGTGAAAVLYDVTLQLPQAIEQNAPTLSDGRSLAAITAHVMAMVKKQYIDSYLFDKFRLREIDFQTGNLTTPEGNRPIDPSIMQQYHQLISGQSEFAQHINNAFLVLTTDKSGVQLYTVSMALGNPIPVVRPYESIGSGSETADSELYAFFENIPREKRSDIDRVEGIAALLFATHRATVRNPGVGGIPLIAILQGNEIIQPDENSSKLGVELVRAARSGVISEPFKREALEGLMYKGSIFADVEKGMWAEAKKLGAERKLSMMLRGYKV